MLDFSKWDNGIIVIPKIFQLKERFELYLSQKNQCKFWAMGQVAFNEKENGLIEIAFGDFSFEQGELFSGSETYLVFMSLEDINEFIKFISTHRVINPYL